MSNPSRRKYQSLLLQILIWLVLGVVTFLYLPLTWGITLPYQFWIKQITIFTLLVALYHVNGLVLVPRLLLQNKTGIFVLSLLSLTFLFMMAVQLSESWLHLPALMEKSFKEHGRYGPPKRDRLLDPFAIMIGLLVLGISTSVASIQKWQKDNQVRILLEQEKTSSELAYLKTQINPHFFFNTLNNIYALMHVDIEGSKTALHKLSRMMRYLLYETQHETTLLSKELAFITDFIELMKLRLSANTEVVYSEPNIVKDFQVSPMLFLPFIENAFKHGINPSQNSFISVKLSVTDSKAELEVVNSLFQKAERTANKVEDNGIGMANTKRRLDLLYPDKHKLSETKDYKEGLYKVFLQIDFS